MMAESDYAMWADERFFFLKILSSVQMILQTASFPCQRECEGELAWQPGPLTCKLCGLSKLRRCNTGGARESRSHDWPSPGFSARRPMWTTSNDVATVFADRYLPDFNASFAFCGESKKALLRQPWDRHLRLVRGRCSPRLKDRRLSIRECLRASFQCVSRLHRLCDSGRELDAKWELKSSLFAATRLGVPPMSSHSPALHCSMFQCLHRRVRSMYCAYIGTYLGSCAATAACMCMFVPPVCSDCASALCILAVTKVGNIALFAHAFPATFLSPAGN